MGWFATKHVAKPVDLNMYSQYTQRVIADPRTYTYKKARTWALSISSKQSMAWLDTSLGRDIKPPEMKHGIKKQEEWENG